MLYAAFGAARMRGNEAQIRASKFREGPETRVSSKRGTASDSNDFTGLRGSMQLIALQGQMEGRGSSRGGLQADGWTAHERVEAAGLFGYATRSAGEPGLVNVLRDWIHGLNQKGTGRP